MRYLWGGCLLLSLVPAFASGQVAEPEPPDQMLERVADEMLSTLRRRQEELRGDTPELYRLVESILVPHVDLELLARFVLGKHWRTASESQRQRFTYGFKDMLIRFYASSMLEYLDFEVRFYPVVLEPEQRYALVRSEFYRGSKAPIGVNYRVALREGQWKAFDVTIDNISVVTNYRGSFDSIIRQEGMEALLEKMENWNERPQTNHSNQQ